MASLFKWLPFLSVLHATLLGIVSSGRAGKEQDKNTKLHMDNMLKVENTVLQQEVKELRAELRVAASGSFSRKRSAQEAVGPLNPLPASAKSRLAADDTQDDARPLLSTDLQDISEAIAQDAAAVARIVEAKGGQQDHTAHAQQDRKVLFVIYSKSKFFDTRIRWARDTWAKNLSSSQLVVIADSEAPKLTGVNIHRTRCQPHDHTMASCCKYAEAVIVAQTLMWQNPELEWAYLADDDSYIRAAALEQALLRQPPSHPHDRGLVLANYGCATTKCSDLLCGGSGYAANRWAIQTMAAGDPAGFVQEMMRSCNQCGGDSVSNKGPWGDAGLSEVIKVRGIEQRTLDGIYGWMMDKSCLEFSLETEKEPLMYHMIRTRAQMELLHRLFAPAGEQTGSSVPPGSHTSLDGVGGCVEFRGNVQCAASRDDEDHPWTHGPPQCKRPHMPRMPVLLGSFTLFLLIAVLAIFIWAGFRHHQWEDWTLQGINWHNYPIQKQAWDKLAAPLT